MRQTPIPNLTNFITHHNHYFHYFNSNCNCKLLAQARYPVWLNGNHPVSPKDQFALARLKYFTSVTQKISEKNYDISYIYKIVLNKL